MSFCGLRFQQLTQVLSTISELTANQQIRLLTINEHIDNQAHFLL